MAQRGRKSAASLAAVTRIPGQRMPPPEELMEEQAEEWRAIVATKPPEWFQRDSQPLLVDYCRHTVICRHLARFIGAFPMDQIITPEGIEQFDGLSKLYDRHSKAVASLAVKLRLAPQSRYEAKVAGTASKNAAAGGGASRPWEIAS